MAPPPAPRADVLLTRARALRAEGDAPAARARLEAALQADPADAEVRVELADVLIGEGQELDRARALLREAGGIDGPSVFLVRARLAEALGDDAQASAEYACALARAEDPDARLRRALANERLGRRAEAAADLARVLEQRPDDAFARGRLAQWHEDSGRLAEAEREYRALAEAQPARAAGWDRLARFYERSGRGADARAARERARAAGGGHGDRALRPLLPSKR